MSQTPQDDSKRAAAEAAVSLVSNGMTLGLGTGSTVQFVLEALARRIVDERITVRGVPTSIRTEQEAGRLGITLTTLEEAGTLDLAIDGADEVERGTLRLIKGLGGALLREKMVAQVAARFVIVADEGKLVSRLGERVPLPVEVVRFAHAATARRIAAATRMRPVLRMAEGAPFVSDNGNHIYDCHGLQDPGTTSAALDAIAGVVDCGLFMTNVEQAIIGFADGGVRALFPERAA